MKSKNSNTIGAILLICSLASSGTLVWLLNSDLTTTLSNNLFLDIEKVNRATYGIAQTLTLLTVGQVTSTVALFLLLFFRNSKESDAMDYQIYGDDVRKEITKINLEKRVNDELQSDDFRFEEHITSLLPSISEFSVGEFSEQLIQEMAKKLEVSQAAMYITRQQELHFISGYAFHKADNQKLKYSFGEGLVGQVAKGKQVVNITEIPDGYVNVISGLGEAKPKSLLIAPLIHEGTTIGVIELASFKKVSKHTIKSMERVCQEVCKHLVEKI